MNGTEQRLHRTVTRDLQTQINDLIEVVSAIDYKQASLWGDTLDAIAAERVRRQTMREGLRKAIDQRGADCQERWDATAATTKRLADCQHAFETRTFWQRLCWLVGGA
jgi:hypothetical protein